MHPPPLLLLLVLLVLQATPSSAFRPAPYTAIAPSCTDTAIDHDLNRILSIRSGAFADDSDSDFDSDSDYQSNDEYDSEEEEEEDVKLSASAVKAMNKAQSQKKKAAKIQVSQSLATAKTSKKKVSPKKHKAANVLTKTKSKGLRVPYLLKAFLNPFTVITMTKGYFASLFNIDYLKEDQSQTLRSALQEKAKQGGGGPSKRSRQRKMKPGQAKTLSDLPQLSA
mmetsp:Transcript_450/g.594  ORF Transcript_450/g.594 Transcript_450/m.594 type:complete len:224 (-) Transcript_450:892-1563(-)|eukprot:CAMPEP_0197247810 /NCGR_PEP_ID=MMETSP1429-20130617/32484_1 /TAXON_ID=49237 /ORGANISM="Chaetoceros  sp., Strain UNC1202" /LENGTH=223 /DNA_ID=CAMNT_0042708831 /DNA_START=123 /DNA_END=794 /DNA_ORIENTATION=+